MGQQEAHEQNNKWKQAFREQASPKSASAKKGSFIWVIEFGDCLQNGIFAFN